MAASTNKASERALVEITDLADAWDSNECAPIKHRLRALVATKLADTEARIAELTTFAKELRETAKTLDSAPLDGPCDDTCGCLRGPKGAVADPLTTKKSAR